MEHLRNLSVYEASPVQFSSFNLQAGTMFSEPAKRFLGKPKVHYMGYNLTVQSASSWQYTMQSHCTTSVQTPLDLPKLCNIWTQLYNAFSLLLVCRVSVNYGPRSSITGWIYYIMY